MLVPALRAILVRELRALQREVEAYPDEEMPWRTTPGIANPGGTLVLHLCGNLEHFVGAVLGGTGYERDREAEFTHRGVARFMLIAKIEHTIGVVERTLDALPEARLAEPYPVAIGGRTLATGTFLMHLAAHLGYHLGQVDYHRRMLDASASPAGTLPLPELPPIG